MQGQTGGPSWSMGTGHTKTQQQMCTLCTGPGSWARRRVSSTCNPMAGHWAANSLLSSGAGIWWCSLLTSLVVLVLCYKFDGSTGCQSGDVQSHSNCHLLEDGHTKVLSEAGYFLSSIYVPSIIVMDSVTIVVHSVLLAWQGEAESCNGLMEVRS